MPYYLVTCPYDSEEPHRIYYEIYGSNNAKHRLVFTMGLGGTSVQWEPQVKYFKTRGDLFQILVYDNRGMGLSDSVSGRWTTTKMAKDILKLLEHLGWSNNVSIVGLSMGGMISQEICRLGGKNQFSSLTLISTIAGGPFSLQLFTRSIPTGLQLAARTFLTTNPNTQLKNGLRLLFPEDFLEAETPHPDTGVLTKNFKLFRSALIKRGIEDKEKGVPGIKITSVFKQAFAVFSHHVSQSELKEISEKVNGNVLIITGDTDILVHPNNSYRLNHGLGGELLVLPRAGHGANEQYGNLVNQAIERIVTKCDPTYCSLSSIQTSSTTSFPQLQSKL